MTIVSDYTVTTQWAGVRCRRGAAIWGLSGGLLAVVIGCACASATSCSENGSPPRPPSTESLNSGEYPSAASIDKTEAETSTETGPSYSETGQPGYYRARINQTLGDVLAGPHSEMVAGYQRVLEAFDVDPILAARAALELAEIAAAQRQRRVALDLIARAAVLGASDPELIDRASQLRHRLAAVSAKDIEVRGPPAGTALAESSEQAKQEFAQAETLLAVYLKRRPSSRLEEVQTSVRNKRGALETAVRAYRKVIALGEPVATAAAEFRIASLYYDLSLSLTSELTREMLPAEAQKFRAFLRKLATNNRRAARAGYHRSLDAAHMAGAGAKRWRKAAQLGLTSVNDLLGSG